MSVLRQQRRVSLRLQRSQLNLRLLFETYTSKSLPPHTLFIAHSQCHLQSYTFTEQSMGGEFCFRRVFIWLMRRRRNNWGFLEAQWGPLVIVRGSAETMQRFSLFSLEPSTALSFCSHTLGLDCQVCSWFKEDTSHWSCIQRLQMSIWRGRWFTMLASLITQWVKAFAVRLWF